MFSLAAYTIKVKQLHKRGHDYCDLSEFGDKKFDIEDFLTDFFGSRLESYLTLPNSRMMRIATLLDITPSRTWAGFIETGDYGYTSDLFDTAANVVSYHRKAPEAEMIPFFFMLSVPANASMGILLLQRFKQFGIKSHLVPELKRAFEKTYSGFGLEIERLVPKTFIDNVLKDGVLKALRFINYELPSDLADTAKTLGIKPVVSSAELIIHARREHSLPMPKAVESVFKRTKNVIDIVELPSFEYSTVKLEMEVGNRRRTINLSSIENMGGNFDITEEISVGPNGHPRPDSIFKVTGEYLVDLLAGVKISVDQPKLKRKN
ncbi:MAG TPA: hypothetical protein VGN52_20105 [Burkholderiales bacterium]|jgi:hypothetical protein